MDKFSINTHKRMAAFLGQLAHESDRFTCLIENLNYSPGGLIETWPTKFNTANAGVYAWNAQAIANRAYADRMGNGDEASGDGWLFRGRGPIQTTGLSDYEDLSAAAGIDFVSSPNLLLRPEYGALAAAWEWNRSGLNALADLWDLKKITKIINGGFLGESDRLEKCETALEKLLEA